MFVSFNHFYNSLFLLQIKLNKNNLINKKKYPHLFKKELALSKSSLLHAL